MRARRFYIVKLDGRDQLVRIKHAARGLLRQMYGAGWMVEVNVGSWGSYQRAARFLSERVFVDAAGARGFEDEDAALAALKGGF